MIKLEGRGFKSHPGQLLDYLWDANSPKKDKKSKNNNKKHTNKQKLEKKKKKTNKPNHTHAHTRCTLNLIQFPIMQICCLWDNNKKKTNKQDQKKETTNTHTLYFEFTLSTKWVDMSR